MSPLAGKLLKPTNWQDFERRARILFVHVLGDPNAQLNGRGGQRQHGVDFWGYRNRSPNQLVGVQCKESEDAVTISELETELAKAKRFRPPISEFILVTTAPRDEKISTRARELTQSLSGTKRPILVAVWGWQDVEERAGEHADAWLAFDHTTNPIAEQSRRESNQRLDAIQSNLEQLQKIVEPLAAPPFDSIDSAANRIFGLRQSIPRKLQTFLFSLMRDKRAVLLEGGKGTGKSSSAVAGARELTAGEASQRAAYYLNANELIGGAARTSSLNAMKTLRPEDLVIIDDLHREPQEATRLVSDALLACRSKLLVVSRPLALEAYELLRDRFSSGTDDQLGFVQAVNPLTDSSSDSFIAAALEANGKPSLPAVVQDFRRLFSDDLTALFDAIEEWDPGDPIKPDLAERRLQRRLELDPDFELGVFTREEMLSCFIATASFWQFELQLARQYLSETLRIDSRIPLTLAQRGVLREKGEGGNRTYELGHEMEARRYVRIAMRSPNFIYPIYEMFESSKLQNARDPDRLVSHLLFLWLGKEEARQITQLKMMHNLLTYRGYPEVLIDATDVFRKNYSLLTPRARIQVLVIGGGIRRRRGAPIDAQEWLKEAARADDQLGGENRGRILYEQAYLSFYENKFEDAEQQFHASANIDVSEVGKEISHAQADAAAYQRLILHDLFTRNLPSVFKETSVSMGDLERLKQKQIEHKRRFTELASDPSVGDISREDARRWISNCLLHLADLCIERADLDTATEYLTEEIVALEAAGHLSAMPKFIYLRGRRALVAGDANAAIPLLMQADKEYQRIGREEEFGDVVVSLGDAHWHRGEHREAFAAYHRVANTVDPNRRNQRGVEAARQRITMLR